MVADIPRHLRLRVGLYGRIKVLQPEVVAIAGCRATYQAGRCPVGENGRTHQLVVVVAGLVVQRAQLDADHQHARCGWPRTISAASRSPLKAAAHPIKPISVRRTVAGNCNCLGKGKIQPRRKETSAADNQQVCHRGGHLFDILAALSCVLLHGLAGGGGAQRRRFALVDLHALGRGGAVTGAAPGAKRDACGGSK